MDAILVRICLVGGKFEKRCCGKKRLKGKVEGKWENKNKIYIYIKVYKLFVCVILNLF